MGWTFSSSWPDKSSLIRHLTQERRDGDRIQRTIAKCVRGTTLYFVSEIERPTGQERILIVCSLASDVKRGGGWGYKDFDESWGPTENTCPPKYFDLVGPPPNEHAANWRARCIAYAERLRRQPKVGDVWVMPGCKPTNIVITQEKPLRGKCWAMTYRLRKRHLGRRVLAVSWLTDAVEGLIYDGNEENAPILADALGDAGCEDNELMGELRSPNTVIAAAAFSNMFWGYCCLVNSGTISPRRVSA